MSDPFPAAPPRQSIVDRMRGPMTLLMLALGGFVLYYTLFFQRKTAYFSGRNARMVARLGSQIRRSINSTAGIVGSASAITTDKEITAMYLYDSALSDEQRPAQAIFSDVQLVDDPPPGKREARRYAYREGTGLRLVFEGMAVKRAPERQFDLRKELTATEKTPPGSPGHGVTRSRGSSPTPRDPETPRPRDPKSVEPQPPLRYQHVAATIPLQRLINTMVRQTAEGLFDTVFILDSSGNVIYQSARQIEDESDSQLKIVRVTELSAGGLFQKAEKVNMASLLSASREMGVRIGDGNYKFFSVPLVSGIGIGEKGKPPAGGEMTSETWVVCGLVSNAQFISRSLAISVTLLSAIAAILLLMVAGWPFMKMGLSNAYQKVTLVDVILLGVSSIFAVSIVCMVVLDWFTYKRLQVIADEQLEDLGTRIERNFKTEIWQSIEQLDAAQKWAERRIARGALDSRNKNLLLPKEGFPVVSSFQSFAFLDERGQQRVKWFVDKLPTPLVRVHYRTYYSAPQNFGREYVEFADPAGGKPRRLTIESIHSATSGQAEVAFSRRTEDTRASDPGLAKVCPVIAITTPTALSVINPILPEGFGFAIVDEHGRVLFHSESERNTVENIFAETDENPEVRSAVAARQERTIDIRYWGDDYRAHVRPMEELPWTLITFRDKHGLRILNTDALIITLVFILVLYGGGLLLFVGLVLFARPRYRAGWLWPDPERVSAYVELAGALTVLLVAGFLLVLGLREGALAAFPFWFLPLVFLITYLYLGSQRQGIKRRMFVSASAVCTASLLVLIWRNRSWSDAAMIFASALLLAVAARAVLRKDDPHHLQRARERQTALPLCYVTAAFLLLLVTGLVPTAAFFRAAYQLELASHVKSAQMKLARDLQERWWRIAGEFNEKRGEGKGARRHVLGRWKNDLDIYAFKVADIDHRSRTAYNLIFAGARPNADTSVAAFPAFIEAILPRYSAAAVNARELARNRADDNSWWWQRRGSAIDLFVNNGPRIMTLSSDVPSLLPTLADLKKGPRIIGGAALAFLLIVVVAFVIARFVARRVFLVDLVNPLWLSHGFLGLRRVICFPCDDHSAERLFRDFRTLDLRKEADLELARSAPQSFPEHEGAVFIDGLGYPFATGERAAIARALIDRLTRNSDRIVVIRPTGLTVITTTFLQGEEGDAWARTLAPFAWVNGSQLVGSAKRLTLSAPAAMETHETAEITASMLWRRQSLRGLYVLSGFDAYFEQFTDTRRVIEKTIAAETAADPYLATLIIGLDTHATGRDQVLDEIGERAEEYYDGLWHTCSPNEQLVLMQLAQTGVVNGKARKDVRRLLARGMVRRDPQLRVMNESFRRFVLAQTEYSALAKQLEQDLGRDAWSRLRLPFFGAVGVVLLFFFTTQQQMFDTTLGVISAVVASLPAFVKTISGWSERGAR